MRQVVISGISASEGFNIASGRILVLLEAPSLLGDVNGDGRPDLLLLDPDYGNNAGAAHVIYGAAAPPTGPIDLPTLSAEQGFRLVGPEFTRTGTTGFAVGDVNGDGRADLLVRTNYYTVVLAPTEPPGAEVQISSLDAARTFRILDSDTSDNIGLVAPIGDVNGDGIGDFAMGKFVREFTEDGTQLFRTALKVAYGIPADSLHDIDASSDAPSGAFRIAIPGNTSIFLPPRAAGDFNGDGVADFVFSYFDRSTGAETVVMLYGKPGGLDGDIDLAALTATQGFRIAASSGGGANYAAGDFNGDGQFDLAVGDSKADGEVGRVAILYGSAGGLAGDVDISALTASQATVIRGGGSPMPRFGRTVDNVGDVNGDGVDDLGIGSQGDTFIIYGQPGGWPGSPAVTSFGTTAGFQLSFVFGQNMSAAGDQNGDGIGDVVALDAHGRNYGVVYGKPDPLARTGTAAPDILRGAGADDTLSGGAEGDWLRGFRGRDTLDGGDGDDALDGGFGADTLRGGAGNDTMIGDYGDDTTGASADSMDGGNGDDGLRGGAGADTLIGGRGHDTLEGHAGINLLNGGDGNDYYALQAPGDIIRERSGRDTAEVSFNYVLNGALEDVVLNGGVPISVRGNTLDNRMQNLSGSATMSGMEGADTLLGGIGNDSLRGGTGNDTADGAEGADTLAGEDGNDTVAGAGGNDLLYGGNGADRLEGGDATDLLNGQAGADTLLGADGNDSASGGTEDDLLIGEAGDDMLTGEAGADTLDGGFGVDRLYGGAGADIFRFSAVPATGNRDTVYDFAAGTDRIQFTLDVFGSFGLVAGSLATQAAHFVANTTGNANAAGVAQIIHETDAGRIWVDLDGIGGAPRQLVLTLVGNPALTAADIVFA
jgi:Ca2+-binding RTX toxin-like protein